MADNSQNSISSSSSGFRKGVVLGLTMAETLILLAFCLLLYVGLLIAKTDNLKERLSGSTVLSTTETVIDKKRLKELEDASLKYGMITEAVNGRGRKISVDINMWTELTTKLQNYEDANNKFDNPITIEKSEFSVLTQKS